jgi:hypothetical protein
VKVTFLKVAETKLGNAFEYCGKAPSVSTPAFSN